VSTVLTTVLTADRVTDVPEQRWDSLVGPDDGYQSHRWLRVLAATSGADMRLLLHDAPAFDEHLPAGTPAAGLVTAFADTSAPWLHGRPDTLLEHCEHLGLPGTAECRRTFGADLTAALMPSLVCGGRHLGRTRALSARPADTVALLDEAERLAARLGVRSVSFPYVDERDVELREILAGRGYHCHVSGRYSWLPLPPGGFEGYLDLLSAHRRRRVRAERRRLQAVGVDSRVEPLTEAVIPRLAELETALLTKYGLRWSPEQSARVLQRAAAELGPSARVSLARTEGRIDGFALLLAHGDQWYAHRAGFDYARQGQLPLYYEVVYYRPVAEAAAAGVTGIHYGVGSAEAKRSRGCVSVAQFAYVRQIDGSAAL
jgi:uncharacterized protein